MEAVNEYYTQAEAARLLRFSPEELLEQMLSTEPFPLYPAVNFTAPVCMEQVCLHPEQEEKTGLFDLFVFGVKPEHGYLPLSDILLRPPSNLPSELEDIEEYCDRCGVDAEHQKFLLETRGIGRFITLSQDGVDYLVCKARSVHLSELLVSRQSLALYANKHGIELQAHSEQRDSSSTASEASQIMTAQRTAERDKFVEKIMAKIDNIVREASRPGGTANRVINHMRFIREAGVPDERLDSVRSQVIKNIKREYGHAGFMALSRAPKKNVTEDYLLPL